MGRTTIQEEYSMPRQVSVLFCFSKQCSSRFKQTSPHTYGREGWEAAAGCVNTGCWGPDRSKPVCKQPDLSSRKPLWRSFCGFYLHGIRCPSGPDAPGFLPREDCPRLCLPTTRVIEAVSNKIKCCSVTQGFYSSALLRL